MNGRRSFVWLTGSVSLALMGACFHRAFAAEPSDDFDLSVAWKVVSNNGADSDSQLRLNNAGPGTVPPSGWAIYFNSARQLRLAEPTGPLALRHINGDFFELRPTAEFKALRPAESCVVNFKGSYWAIKESDAPSGFYLVSDEQVRNTHTIGHPLKTTVAPFISPKQTMRSPADKTPVPTAESRYEDNLKVNSIVLTPGELFVPTPAMTIPQQGEVRIDSSTIIAYSPGLDGVADLLAEHLGQALGASVKTVEGLQAGANVVRLQLRRSARAPARTGLASEAYTLDVRPDQGIDVVGSSAAGVFYGIQSLRALLPIEAYRQPAPSLRIAAIHIEDAPRFAYRGLHLDVARNFHSKETVKKLLDLMAFYKLNRFHFHLTDDEGWRLDIKAFPELTEVGARRGHTLTETDRLVPSLGSGFGDPGKPSLGCGFYTQEDFIEILRYAQARNIEVIPELDFPGHARAAIKSMQARSAKLRAAGDLHGSESCLLTDPSDQSTYESVQLWRDNVADVGLESTYAVIGAIFDEVKSLYARAGVPLFAVHIGGDEVPEGAWQKSPACRQLLQRGDVADLSRESLHHYFVGRVIDLLHQRRLRAACWEECVLRLQEQDGKLVKVPRKEFLNKNVVVYVWNNVWGWGQEDVAYRLANAGYDVVLANATNLYFDLAYDKDPTEPGYYWADFVDERKPFEFAPLDFYQNAHTNNLGAAIDPVAYQDAPRLTVQGKRRVLGMQGQLWSETLSTKNRLEHAAFPKVISLAERAWSPNPAWTHMTDDAARQAEIKAAWNRFANRLGQRELPRLDYFHSGVNYRIPPPGARIEVDMLHANVAYPGLTIRYTLDGAPPNEQSMLYQGPAKIHGSARLRAFNSRGHSSRDSKVDATPRPQTAPEPG